jgi:hypothetical protein
MNKSRTGELAETAVVRRGTLLVTVDAASSLAPGAEVSLSFSSGGRVAKVLVEEGLVVEAGQPLARLETDGLELQVAQAQAALAAAEAQLAQLLAPRARRRSPFRRPTWRRPGPSSTCCWRGPRRRRWGILFVPQILHVCPYRWGFSQRPRLWLAGRDDVVDL